jgi:NAD+ synthase
MDHAEVSEQIAAWLHHQVGGAGAEGLVFGLSGGIDSAVTGALCKRACPDGVLGLIMPCQSDPQDAVDAGLVAQTFGIPTKRIPLESVYDQFLSAIGEAASPHGSRDLAFANLKPRLRMTALYFWANRLNYLVAGSGNLSEITVGYMTKVTCILGSNLNNLE